MSTTSRKLRTTSATGAALTLTAMVAMSASAEPGGEPPAPNPGASDRHDVTEIAEQISAHWDDPGFGKVTVSYEGARVTVLWKGEPPESVQRLEGVQPNGVTVDIGSSLYSQADVYAAAAEVVTVERARTGTASAVAIVPNDDLSGAIVEVSDGTKTALNLLEAQHAFDRAVVMPLEIRLVPNSRVPLTRQNDSAPWQGGGAIQQNNNCSTGFAIIRSGGEGRLLSASHCGYAVGDTIRDGNGDVIGTVSNRANTWDSILIDPAASPATVGKVFGGPWDAGTGHNRYQFFVGGSSAPSNSEEVCTSGAMTGEHQVVTGECTLNVIETGVTFPCGPGLNSTCQGFRVGAAGVVAGAGDSGGPVYLMRADGKVGARGIITNGIHATVPCGGSAEPTTCFDRIEATGIHNLLSYWNSTIETG